MKVDAQGNIIQDEQEMNFFEFLANAVAGQQSTSTSTSTTDNEEEKKKEMTAGIVRLIQFIVGAGFTVWYVKKYDFKNLFMLILGLAVIWIVFNAIIIAIKQSKQEKK
jgi:sugar phosphate permease